MFQKSGLYFLIFCSFILFGLRASAKDNMMTLEGRYTGSYNDISYELWVEDTRQQYNTLYAYEDIDEPKQVVYVVMLFETARAEAVNQTLNKYQYSGIYYNAICEFITPENSSSFYPEAANKIWNKIGALGLMYIINGIQISSVGIEPIHYIDLPENNQYGLKAVVFNDKGEVSTVQMFKTGFLNELKDSLIPSHAEIELKKVSSTNGLLRRYYKSRTEALRSYNYFRSCEVVNTPRN